MTFMGRLYYKRQVSAVHLPKPSCGKYSNKKAHLRELDCLGEVAVTAFPFPKMVVGYHLAEFLSMRQSVSARLIPVSFL